ncbi:MAG: prepilin-type N-terminal cleavage/methylation domain-containing protein [Akkermansiaceae bacterium]|nr:prepilin-type N-terminal cleavage/methylation domain-containing protein [Verrucomicrobiales bacterium]
MNFKLASRSWNSGPVRLGRRGFSLIEIMVVVGVIAIITVTGAPTLIKVLRKEGFRKTVSDVMDVCSSARARAILKGQVTEVVFQPQERTCAVAGGGVHGGWASSAVFDDSARVEMLDVNLREYKDANTARVRFFPNGTCDEMTLILVSDKNEWRKISTEITTGLASLESDPTKWK